jgi:hypothetical protein
MISRSITPQQMRRVHKPTSKPTYLGTRRILKNLPRLLFSSEFPSINSRLYYFP